MAKEGSSRHQTKARGPTIKMANNPVYQALGRTKARKNSIGRQLAREKVQIQSNRNAMLQEK